MRIIVIFLVVAFFWLTIGLLAFSDPTPIVRISWSTKKCVQVEPAPYSCDRLPERYEIVWVR